MPKEFTLGRNERLKSRKLIEQLFKEGKSFVQFPFRVYYTPAPAEAPALQFGIGVSTRNFKKAVDRNRIKRLAREAWRLQKNDLLALLKEQNKALAVFFIYTGKEIPVYAEVHSKTAVILQRLKDLGVEKKSGERER